MDTPALGSQPARENNPDQGERQIPGEKITRLTRLEVPPAPAQDESGVRADFSWRPGQLDRVISGGRTVVVTVVRPSGHVIEQHTLPVTYPPGYVVPEAANSPARRN
jgi:hypothetical protein